MKTAPVPTTPEGILERMQYLGCLKLLGDCALHVPSEIRECIACALEDAQKAGLITYTQVIHRFDVDAVLTQPSA